MSTFLYRAHGSYVLTSEKYICYCMYKCLVLIYCLDLAEYIFFSFFTSFTCYCSDLAEYILFCLFSYCSCYCSDLAEYSTASSASSHITRVIVPTLLSTSSYASSHTYCSRFCSYLAEYIFLCFVTYWFCFCSDLAEYIFLCFVTYCSCFCSDLAEYIFLCFVTYCSCFCSDLAEYIFLCFFIGETVVRMWALGPSIYFEASFNRYIGPGLPMSNCTYMKRFIYTSTSLPPPISLLKNNFVLR